MHNVLSNIRSLSPGSADRLMRALNLQIPDLLWRRSADVQSGVTPVPLLRHRVGPGAEADLEASMGYYPLPASLLTGLMTPVLARLSPDLLLPRALAHGDLVLLDQNPALRANPGDNSCWVVLEQGGHRVRYLKRREGLFCIASESTVHNPAEWRPIPDTHGNILNIVRARIVWISREMET